MKTFVSRSKSAMCSVLKNVLYYILIPDRSHYYALNTGYVYTDFFCRIFFVYLTAGRLRGNGMTPAAQGDIRNDSGLRSPSRTGPDSTPEVQ